MLEDVILVNGADEKTGLKDKTQTHIGGDLHRAFTTVIYRINHRTGKLEVLAAQRAEEKETWGGIWDCTYSSHQRDGETSEEASHRKMAQELNIKGKLEDFKFLFKFWYWAQWNHPVNGVRYEHEIDQALIIELKPEIKYKNIPFNRAEIKASRWIPFKDLMDRNRAEYGPWTNIIIDRLGNYEPFCHVVGN